VGLKALHLASYAGKPAVVKVLIEFGFQGISSFYDQVRKTTTFISVVL
jgi:hypothetical protein